MDKKEFLHLVNNVIIPLFTGSEYAGEVSSNQKESSVAFSDGLQTLLIKPSREDNYRFKIIRQQYFSKDDKQIMEEIITELTVYDQIPVKYKDELLPVIVENALSKHLSGNDKNAHCLSSIITSLRNWSGRTYEGRDVAFGIEIDLLTDDDSKLEIKDILDLDFSALLSDGVDSFFKVNKYGKMLGLQQSSSCIENNSKIPFRFVNIAMSFQPTSIGILLLRNKEILIIKNRELVFAFRRGLWRHFNHDAIIQRIAAGSRYTDEETRKAIYETCLDVSFARTGGSITYLRKTYESECIKKHIDEKDLVSSNDIKSSSISLISNNKDFKSIPRKIRQELVGIDGATLIDGSGKILAAGAIIKIEAGSSGGGRLASVKTLSSYGVSIKISSDGEIIAFSTSKDLNLDTQKDIDKNNIEKENELSPLFVFA